MKTKAIITIIIVVAICIVGGVIAFMLLNQGNGSGGGASISTSSGGASGQGLSFEENQDKSIKQVQSITMPGWESIKLNANSTSASVDFYNPSENTGLFHMTFELKLKDTNETLYKSGLVKAGDHLRNITLKRGLPAGTYDAIVHIQPYTADEAMSATNNADVAVKLIVV